VAESPVVSNTTPLFTSETDLRTWRDVLIAGTCRIASSWRCERLMMRRDRRAIQSLKIGVCVFKRPGVSSTGCVFWGDVLFRV
jgi:hypothetical protein